jgi:hypothetical protein
MSLDTHISNPNNSRLSHNLVKLDSLTTSYECTVLLLRKYVLMAKAARAAVRVITARARVVVRVVRVVVREVMMVVRVGAKAPSEKVEAKVIDVSHADN